MFTIIESDKTQIYFIGDIHGEFNAIGNWIKQCNLNDCLIIFCGDFGLGFSSVQNETSELKKSNEICDERNIDCYVIRGNHDDPSYFNNNVPKLVLSRIKTVSDYTVINTPQHNILCLGGAVSVDRFYRQTQYEYDVRELMIRRNYSLSSAMKKAKLYWWDKEPFVYDETIIKEINKAGICIDTVASHSAPDFCKPYVKESGISFSNIDKELEKDLQNERLDFTKTYNLLKDLGNNIQYWFYGHFHQHNSEIIELTRFTCLDMGRHSKNGGGVGGNFDMAEIYN